MRISQVSAYRNMIPKNTLSHVFWSGCDSSMRSLSSSGFFTYIHAVYPPVQMVHSARKIQPAHQASVPAARNKRTETSNNPTTACPMSFLTSTTIRLPSFLIEFLTTQRKYSNIYKVVATSPGDD